jgi:hypothetical protein
MDFYRYICSIIRIHSLFSAKEFEHRRPAIAAAHAGDGLDGAPLDHAHKAFKRVSAFGHADQV